jgi:hypothetical protein
LAQAYKRIAKDLGIGWAGVASTVQLIYKHSRVHSRKQLIKQESAQTANYVREEGVVTALAT